VRILHLIYLLIGVALFAAIMAAFDFEAAVKLVWQVGLLGIAALVALHVVGAVFDVIHALLLTLPLPVTPRWVARMFRVRLVSEALNLVIPAGGMGGEPAKAALLKAHYRVGLKRSSIGIVLTRITAVMAQFLFVAAALVVMSIWAPLPPLYQTMGWIGLGVLAAMTAAFVLLFRGRLASRLGRRLATRRWSAKLARGLRGFEAVERDVDSFFGRHPGRFALAIGFAAARTVLEVAEIYVALDLLGHPVSIAEAMVVEGMLQLVCTVGFAIPANIGTQDAAMTVVVGAFVGVPGVGLAVALLRRLRELIMIGVGFAIGGHFGWAHLARRRSAAPAE
jgi:hypothetical protein